MGWYSNVYYSYRDYPVKGLNIKYKKSELKGVYNGLMKKLFTNLQVNIFNDHQYPLIGRGISYQNNDNLGRNNNRNDSIDSDSDRSNIKDNNKNGNNKGVKINQSVSVSGSQSSLSSGLLSSNNPKSKQSQSQRMNKCMMSRESLSNQLSKSSNNNSQSNRESKEQQQSVIIKNSQSSSILSNTQSEQSSSDVSFNKNNNINININININNKKQSRVSVVNGVSSSFLSSQKSIQSQSLSKNSIQQISKSRQQIQHINQQANKLPSSFANRLLVKKARRKQQINQQRQTKQKSRKKIQYQSARVYNNNNNNQQSLLMIQERNMEVFYQLMVKMIPLTLKRITVQIDHQLSSYRQKQKKLQIIGQNQYQYDDVEDGESQEEQQQQQQSLNSKCKGKGKGKSGFQVFNNYDNDNEDDEVSMSNGQSGRGNSDGNSNIRGGNSNNNNRRNNDVNSNNNGRNNDMNSNNNKNSKMDQEKYNYVVNYASSITSSTNNNNNYNKNNSNNNQSPQQSSKHPKFRNYNNTNNNNNNSNKQMSKFPNSSTSNSNSKYNKNSKNNNSQYQTLADIQYPQTVEQIKYYFLEYALNTKVVYNNKQLQEQQQPQQQQKSNKYKLKDNNNNKSSLSQSSSLSDSNMSSIQQQQQPPLNNHNNPNHINTNIFSNPHQQTAHNILKTYLTQQLNHHPLHHQQQSTSQIQTMIMNYSSLHIQSFNLFLNHYYSKIQQASAIVNVIGFDAIAESMYQMAVGKEARNNGIKTQVGLGSIKVKSFSTSLNEENHNILLTTWVDLVLYTSDTLTLYNITQNLNTNSIQQIKNNNNNNSNNKKKTWTPSISTQHNNNNDHTTYNNNKNNRQKQPHSPTTSTTAFRQKMLSLLNFMILNNTKNILLQSITKSNFLSIVIMEILANRHDHRSMRQFQLKPLIQSQMLAKQENKNKKRWFIQQDQAIIVYDIKYKKQLWVKQSLQVIYKKWGKVVEIIFQQQVRNQHLYWELVLEKCVGLINRQLSLLTVLTFNLVEIIENINQMIQRIQNDMSYKVKERNNNNRGDNNNNKNKNKNSKQQQDINKKRNIFVNDRKREILRYKSVQLMIQKIIRDLIGCGQIFNTGNQTQQTLYSHSQSYQHQHQHQHNANNHNHNANNINVNGNNNLNNNKTNRQSRQFNRIQHGLKLLNREQNCKQLSKWQQIMQENILIVQSYISNIEIITKIFNHHPYHVATWVISFDKQTRTLIRKVNKQNLEMFFQKFYQNIPKQWTTLNYQQQQPQQQQSKYSNNKTNLSVISSPVQRRGMISTNKQRISSIKRKKQLTIQQKQALIINYMIKAQLQLYQSYTMSHVINCRQLSTTMTTIVTTNYNNNTMGYNNRNKANYPYLLEDHNIQALLLFNYKNISNNNNNSNSNSSSNKQKDIISNRLFVKRTDKVNLTVKPLSSFAPSYTLSPRHHKKQPSQVISHNNKNNNNKKDQLSSGFNKSNDMGSGFNKRNVIGSGVTYKQRREQQRNVQYEIDVSLLQSINYTVQQLQFLGELNNHLKYINEINFQYEFYYWKVLKFNNNNSNNSDGNSQITSNKNGSGQPQEKTNNSNQQRQSLLATNEQNNNNNNNKRQTYPPHERKMVTLNEYSQQKTQNLLSTQQLYSQFQQINQIMTTNRPLMYNNQHALYLKQMNLKYMRHQQQLNYQYTNQGYIGQQKNNRHYESNNNNEQEEQQQQQKILYEQKMRQFRSRLKVHNQSLILIVNAALQAKNYWKAVSINVFPEDQTIASTNQQSNSNKNNNTNTTDKNTIGNNTNTTNNNTTPNKQPNNNNNEISMNNNNKISMNNNNEISINFQSKFFYNKILQKLQQYINHYRDISHQMNYSLESQQSQQLQSQITQNQNKDHQLNTYSKQKLYLNTIKETNNNRDQHNQQIRQKQQNHNQQLTILQPQPIIKRRQHIKKPSILQTIELKSRQRVRVYSLLQGLISRNSQLKKNRFQMAASIYQYSQKILLLNCYMASFYIQRAVYLQIISQNELSEEKYNKIKIIGKQYFRKIKQYSSEIYMDREITQTNLKNIQLVYQKKVLILLVSLMQLLYYGNQQASTLRGKWKSRFSSNNNKEKKMRTVREMRRGERQFERGYKNHAFKISKSTLNKYGSILKKFLKYRLKQNTLLILSKQNTGQDTNNNYPYSMNNNNYPYSMNNNNNNKPTQQHPTKNSNSTSTATQPNNPTSPSPQTNNPNIPDYSYISKVFWQMFQLTESTEQFNEQIFISMLRKLRNQQNDQNFLKFFITIIEQQTQYLQQQFQTEQQKVNCLKKKFNYLLLREVYFFLHYDIDCLQQKSAYSKKNYQMYQNRVLDFYDQIITKNQQDFITKKELQLKKRSVYLQNYQLKYQQQPNISSIQKSLNKLIVCVFNQILLIYTQDIKMEIKKKCEQVEMINYQIKNQYNNKQLHTVYLSGDFYQNKILGVKNKEQQLGQQQHEGEQQQYGQLVNGKRGDRKRIKDNNGMQDVQSDSNRSNNLVSDKNNGDEDRLQKAANILGNILSGNVVNNNKNNNNNKRDKYIRSRQNNNNNNNKNNEIITTSKHHHQQTPSNLSSQYSQLSSYSNTHNNNTKLFKVFTLQSMSLHQAINIYQTIKTTNNLSIQKHYLQLKNTFTNVKALKRQDLTEMEIQTLSTNQQSIVSLLKKQVIQKINQLKFTLVHKNLISRIQKLYINLDVRHKVFQSFKDKILSYQMQKAKIYHQYMDYIRGLKLDVYSHIANQDSLPYIKILHAIKLYRLQVKKQELQNKVRQQFGKNLKKWNQGIQQDLHNYQDWLLSQQKHWEQTKYNISQQKKQYLLIYDSIKKQLKRQSKKKQHQQIQSLKRSSQNIKQTLQFTFSDMKNLSKSYKQLKKVTASKKNLFILNQNPIIQPQKNYNQQQKISQNISSIKYNVKQNMINNMTLSQTPQILFMAQKNNKKNNQMKKSNSLHNLNHRSLSKYSSGESKKLQRPTTSMHSEYPFSVNTIKAKSKDINRASTAVTRQKSMDLQTSQFRGIKMKFNSKSSEKFKNYDEFFKQEPKNFKRSIHKPQIGERIMSGYIGVKKQQASQKQIDIGPSKSKKLIKQARVINSALPQRKGILKNF